MQSANAQLHPTPQDVLISEKEGGVVRSPTSRPIPTAIPAFLTRPAAVPTVPTSVECNSLVTTATPCEDCDHSHDSSNKADSQAANSNSITITSNGTASSQSRPDQPSVDAKDSSIAPVNPNSAQPSDPQQQQQQHADHERKPDYHITVEKVSNGESNSVVDADVDPASSDESSDSLHHALTKTALCSALFSLTRARKLPLQQANQLSKILCSNNQCLAEFEQVHTAMESLEKSGDRAHEEWLARKAEATLIDTETSTPTDASLLLPSGSPQKSMPSVSPNNPDSSPPRNRKKGFWSGLVGGSASKSSPSHAKTPSKNAAASPVTGSPISHVSTPLRPSPLLAPPTPRTPQTPTSPVPSESPRIMYHKQAEELMWNWIQIQMEQLQFSTTASNGVNNATTADTAPAATASSSAGLQRSSASHSHSTPNLQQLASSASFAATSSSSSSTLRPPVLVSIPPRAPASSGTDHYSRPSLLTGSPSTPGHALPSSVSFNSALRPASSVPNTPSGGSRYSPARIWKSIFGGGHSAVHVGNGSFSSHPNLTPLLTSPSTNPHHASTSAGTTTIATEAFAQHFDSFPRIDDTMLSVVHAQLPPSAISWLNDATNTMLNDEGQSFGLGALAGGLKCHSSLPFPAAYPMNVLPLHDNTNASSNAPQQQMEADVLLDVPLPPRSPSHSHHSSTSSSGSTNLLSAAQLPSVVSQSPQVEQAHLDTWSDLLLNYRKHISKRLGMAPPLVLWNWWHTQWVTEQTDIDAHAASKIEEQSQLPQETASPSEDEDSEPRFHDDEHDGDSQPPPRDVQAIPFRLPEGNDSPPLSPRLTSCKCESLPPPRALSPTHLRLLLLLLQWASLTPFDLRQCIPTKEKVLEFLRTLLTNPDDASRTHNNSSVARWMEVAKSIQAVLENVEEEDPSGMGAYIDHLTHDGETTSPLQLVPFPFSDDVDRVYSSRLFTYPPFQLARELTLHSFELLRKIPLREWMDGAWQQKKGGIHLSMNGRSHSNGGNGLSGHKVSTSTTGDEDEAYTNAYSIASASMSPFTDQNFSSAPSTPAPSTPAPTPNPAFASVSSTSSCTKHFIADFNRLVYWICTEILHPSLRASQRFDLVLYFLEVAMISLKVFRNFHVAFAVSAAFSTQPLYRLPEIQELSKNELKYHAPTQQLQKAMEGDLTPNAAGNSSNVSTPAVAAEGETPLASPDPVASKKKSQNFSSMSVKQQYEELKQVTSTRNNYAFYRSVLSSLLASDSQQSNQNGLFSAHGAPPPLSWAESNTPSVRQSRTSSMDSTYSLHTPLATDGIPLSPTAFAAHSIQRVNSTGSDGSGLPTSSSSSSLDAYTYLRQNSSSNSLNGAATEGTSSLISFIPHLAVHLKDLTYSQELSGVEQQWVEEQVDIIQHANSGKLAPSLPTASLAVSHTFSPMASPKVVSSPQQHRETYSLTAFDSAAARHSSDSSASPPSAFSCRFDRSRWSRTSKLIFHLLRFQSLPVYTVHLPSHIPPLYTLLQVHLLTHVLPEPELLNMSLEICPRVDKNKLKQATQQKKALTALREEGFL